MDALAAALATAAMEDSDMDSLLTQYVNHPFYHPPAPEPPSQSRPPDSGPSTFAEGAACQSSEEDHCSRGKSQDVPESKAKKNWRRLFEKVKKILRSKAFIVGITTVGAISAVAAVPLVVAALGFQSSGIVAGSAAASMMSTFGGAATASGSAVATLQSIGATGSVLGPGVATATFAVTGAVKKAVVGTSAVTGAVKKAVGHAAANALADLAADSAACALAARKAANVADRKDPSNSSRGKTSESSGAGSPHVARTVSSRGTQTTFAPAPARPSTIPRTSASNKSSNSSKKNVVPKSNADEKWQKFSEQTKKVVKSKGFIIGTSVAAGTLGVIGAIAAAPFVIAGLGFTSTGIAAGSAAASMMSALGGGATAAGSTVAVLQGIGATGTVLGSVAATSATAATGAVVGLATGAGVGAAASASAGSAAPEEPRTSSGGGISQSSRGSSPSGGGVKSVGTQTTASDDESEE